MAHETSSRKPRSLSQSQTGGLPNIALNPPPGPPPGSGNPTPTSSTVQENAVPDPPAPHINLPTRSELDKLLEQLSSAPEAGPGAVPRSPRLLRVPVTPFNSPTLSRQRQGTAVPGAPTTASQLKLVMSHGKTISAGATAAAGSVRAGAATDIRTTSTTSTSVVTTTTSTTSTVNPATAGAGGGKTSTGRRKEGAGKRRHRSMDHLLDPASVPGNSLPEKLTKPEVMAAKLARTETSNFSLIATRRQETPVYHLEFAEPEINDFYKTMWLPYQALLARHLEPCFDLVDKGIEAAFDKWQDLLRSLDGESALRKRAELLPYANVSDSSRARIAKNVARVSARDLCELAQAREILAPGLEPLIAAIQGEGTSLLNSGLPPILLYFLLELDRQHTENWQAHSREQLEWQLLYCHAREGYLLIAGLRDKGMEAESALEEQVRKDLLSLKEYRTRLEARGKTAGTELKSFQALAEVTLTPKMVSALKDEVEQHDDAFQRIRRQAIEAFIGLRGCSAILRLRNTDPDKNSDKARLYQVLAKLFSRVLAEHPFIDRLLACDANEREQIRRAAVNELAGQQEAWGAICKDQLASRRWKRLVEAKQPSSANLMQPSVEYRLAANSPLTRSDKTPERKRDDADLTRGRRYLSQPDKFLSEAKLVEKRKRRALGFLDEFEIEKKAKSVPELADKRTWTDLTENLFALAQGKVSDENMLDTVNTFLDQKIFSMAEDPSKDLVRLRADLGSTLVALRSPPAHRRKSPTTPSQNSSGSSSGASTPPRAQDSSSSVSNANTPSPLGAAGLAFASSETQDNWNVIDRSPPPSRRPYKPGPSSRPSIPTEPQEKPQEKLQEKLQEKPGASDQ